VPRMFANLRLSDLADVAIVAILLWMLIVWLRTTRARFAAVGLAILAGLYLVVQQFELQLTVWLFQGFFAAVVLVLVVVFQDDLRRLFERIAVAGMLRRQPRAGPDVIDKIARAVEELARSHTGALIVVPGRDPLDRHVQGGTYLRGRASEALLLSLFDPHSIGHDGAVMIEGNDVTRFEVHLPLPVDADARTQGGLRHAAALGLSERSDALCIVVSEERGTVSVAQNGRLRTLVRPESVAAELRRFLHSAQPAQREAGMTTYLRAAPAHWREGILAFAMALVLWLAFVPGDSIVSVAFAVPVRVENLPQGYELREVDPPQVEVTLTGRRRDLYLAKPGQVEVRIDALLVQLGRRTFEVSPELVEHPRALSVVSVTPERVRVQVSREGAEG
jgi:diadenylate cyclase